MTTPTHGGARARAGRPPIYGEATRSVSLILPVAVVMALDEEAKRRGLSRSRVVTELLRK